MDKDAFFFTENWDAFLFYKNYNTIWLSNLSTIKSYPKFSVNNLYLINHIVSNFL